MLFIIKGGKLFIYCPIPEIPVLLYCRTFNLYVFKIYFHIELISQKYSVSVYYVFHNVPLSHTSGTYGGRGKSQLQQILICVLKTRLGGGVVIFHWEGQYTNS